MDNKWLGTLKQKNSLFLELDSIYHESLIISGCRIINMRKFAKRTGFAENRIKLGFYTASVSKFQRYYTANKLSKENEFPKVLVCVCAVYSSKELKDALGCLHGVGQRTRLVLAAFGI